MPTDPNKEPMTPSEIEERSRGVTLRMELNTAMALLRDFHETSVRVIGSEGWQSGINRDELMECGRKYWKLREAIAALSDQDRAQSAGSDNSEGSPKESK